MQKQIIVLKFGSSVLRDENDVPSAVHEIYATAARVGGAVVQRKAIDFAEHHRLKFTVSSIASCCATEIGPHADSIALAEVNPEPLRVVLLGCGAVGGGVYQQQQNRSV
jgi:homoserine dehydrogenase